MCYFFERTKLIGKRSKRKFIWLLKNSKLQYIYLKKEQADW